jgi:hypothetical protein
VFAKCIIAVRAARGGRIVADAVDAPVPLCVVEPPGSHVRDFGMALTTATSGDAVLAAQQTRGNGEYPTLRVIPIAGLPAFLAAAVSDTVPPAPIFPERAFGIVRPAPPPR